MTRKLVFVHGRAQERLDSVALKNEWIAAWKAGLDKAGLAMPLAETDIRFPYYGDSLEQMTAGQTADEAARIIVRGQDLDRAEESFLKAWLLEIQTVAGISDAEVAAVVDPNVRTRGVLNWSWVQGILQVLDTKVPGASAASLSVATKDVYSYLTNQAIRDAMDGGVRSAFTANTETVVVSHSLGTVVAYNVLRRDGDIHSLQVPLFVTLGSPLAVTAVKKAIRPIDYPSCVKHWFNAMDERDVVALFPLDSVYFAVNPAIENKTDVDNPTENRHGISGYLGDPEVAKRIHDAVIS